MNDSRNAIIDNFLDQNGIAGGKRSLIASDASKRRYERIKKDGKSFILMDAPPPLENVHPFVIMAQHLIKLGYSAPKVMAVDKEAGLLLLEDLGDNTYSAVIEKGGDEFALFLSGEAGILIWLKVILAMPKRAFISGLFSTK